MKSRAELEVEPPFKSVLIWSASVVLVVLLSAALALTSMREKGREGQAIASLSSETDRIDHSQVDWEAMTAEPDASPMAVAAYGFGS